MAKKNAVVNRRLCVACGACAKVCPREAISLPLGIFSFVDTSKCVGCGLCAKECPASVISVEVA